MSINPASLVNQKLVLAKALLPLTNNEDNQLALAARFGVIQLLAAALTNYLAEIKAFALQQRYAYMAEIPGDLAQLQNCDRAQCTLPEIGELLVLLENPDSWLATLLAKVTDVVRLPSASVTNDDIRARELNLIAIDNIGQVDDGKQVVVISEQDCRWFIRELQSLIMRHREDSQEF